MGQPHRRGSTGKRKGEGVQAGRFYLFKRRGIIRSLESAAYSL